MAIIIPALLTKSKEEFEEKLLSLPENAEIVSIDIMNGTFVEQTTFFDADEIKKIKTTTMYELDLMVREPLPIIKKFATIPNTIRAIVHPEIITNARDLMTQIKSLGLEVGLSLLPKTQISEFEHLFNEVNMIMVRGNEPGLSGQGFDELMYQKIETLSKNYPHIPIEVDIGVNSMTIPKLVAAGATHLCANSAIFEQKDRIAAFFELSRLAEQ